AGIRDRMATVAENKEVAATGPNKSLQRQIDHIAKDRDAAMKIIMENESMGPSMSKNNTVLQKRVDDYDGKIKDLQDKMDTATTPPAAAAPAARASAAPVGAWTAPPGSENHPPERVNDKLRDKASKKVVAVSTDGKTWGPPPKD
ncbi:MAG: hypothetical protein WAM47_01755, partial [Candidatus Sulfotelmatobacter sp.]